MNSNTLVTLGTIIVGCLVWSTAVAIMDAAGQLTSVALKRLQ